MNRDKYAYVVSRKYRFWEKVRAILTRPWVAAGATKKKTWRMTVSVFILSFEITALRVEFLLKTDSGYPRDAEVTLLTLYF